MVKRYTIYLLFTVYLLLGIIFVPGYGVGWDEWYMRENAVRNVEWAKAFFNGEFDKRNTIFEGNVDEHGPAFQLVLLKVEHLFQPTSIKKRVLVRHYTAFVVFAFLSLGFYLLLKRAGFSTQLSLLGWMALVLYPRIMAHAAFNPKDPLLMGFFIWASYLLLLIHQSGKWRWHLLFGMLLGLMVDIRVIALVFLAPYGLIWLSTLIRKRTYSTSLVNVGIVLAGFISIAICAWPYLWHDPLASFINQFKVITEVKQPNPTLFFGEFYLPKEAPWWYLPGYLLITIPLIIWIPFSYGIFEHLKCVIQKGKQELEEHLLFWIAVIIFCIPLLAAMILTPVFYNGWRHFQFMYPFILILALYGLKPILQMKTLTFKGVNSYAIVMLVFVVLSYANIRYYPFGNLYFNTWIGKDLEQEFECDYWGVGTNNAWDYLSEHTTGKVRVLTSDKPVSMNLELLTLEDQSRFELVNSLEEADYFITNHNHFQDFSTPLWHSFYFGPHRPALGKEVYRAGSFQATAVRVYKLR